MKIEHGTEIDGQSFYPKDKKTTIAVTGTSISVRIRAPYVGRAFLVQSSQWGEGILVILPGVELEDVKF